jgi:hypothetical protein
MKTTIVIAWAEKSDLRPPGKPVRPDGVNWVPEFEPCWEGKACVWLNESTESKLFKDCKNAKAYLTKQGYKFNAVYCYAPEFGECLPESRKRILEEATRKGAA